MTINVRNISGDYYLKTLNGEIFVVSSGTTFITPVATFTNSVIVNNSLTVAGSTVIGISTASTVKVNSRFISDLIPLESELYNLGTPTNTWNNLSVETAEFFNGNNPGNIYLRPYDPLDIYDTEANRRLASVYFNGGVGIEKDLNVGGYIYGRIETANTSTFISSTATNIDNEFYISFVSGFNQSGTLLYGDNSGLIFNGIQGLRYNPEKGRITTEQLIAISTQSSTTTDTGAVIVKGGVGVGENLNVENKITANEVSPRFDNSGTLGTTLTNWAESYIQEIYTKVIKTNNGPLEIIPKDPLTDIYGDIRVRGVNPIGTAPMVTNTLYVTVDGNDTNDGRAQDSSRACRTIGGALNSPYYQPGTQILVSAGHYLEDNPLRLKPYTSIRGSDIRTTFIEPINKTQDLFHLESGCYLNYMTFLNGRSGLLDGPYESGFNRGAYATAFPPLEGNERIDLFNSPYVQNCTNQSGPWLKDGTMFVPNQTVQVPSAVGVGTWPSNTTTIVVEVSTGTITQGMNINAGQQNPGFYNARTLLLANKPFLQEQVIKYVDITFNSGTFYYNTASCERDIGLIVDSIATDLIQESDSESIFAGLQYWNQTSYVDGIGSQITTTTDAISYVRELAISTVTNASNSFIGSEVGTLFDTILNIVNNGTVGVSNIIIANDLASLNTDYINAYNALIDAKQSIEDQTILHINSSLTNFTYNIASCERDTGLIVDSLVLDILFNGTSQSNFAGLQYWNQSGYVNGIADEITTTTNAITYVKNLVAKIVQNNTSSPRYQSTVTQNISLPAATSNEVSILNTDFDVILNILNIGTANVSNIIVPNSIDPSTSTNVINAFRLIQINKTYIQEEAIAFVESTKTPGFIYDQVKCYRDVGYIIDSISFDLLYGGNKQAVQSGVYYYGFNPSSSAVDGEIPQVVAAYNYIKELVDKIILNIPVTNLYQTVEPQIFGKIGTYIEVQSAQLNLDKITNIIKNGPSVADAPSPISLNRSTENDIISSAEILNLNRTFIQKEVIAYVNTLYTFLYDQEKCRRDINYMIDSVAFDLLHSGNKQSIKSGVYYYNYSSNSSAIQNEIAQTSRAYDFIKNIIPDIVTGNSLITTYQNVVNQVIPGIGAGVGLTTSTISESNILQSKIDIITNIIRNGPDEVESRIPINLETSSSTNVLYAFELLKANRSFIQAETIAFIDQTFGTFDYSREKCFRDVGILVENISYDAAFGGNEKSVESGLAYYDGVISRISGQEPQTIAAIDYLNNLSQKIITNTICDDLYFNGVTTTATYSQVVNTSLSNGQVASLSIENLFNIVTTIIDNGPLSAPEIYKTSNVDAAFVSAETLMQANRKFIQEDTINYVNNIIYQGALPYSEIKCRRDTGLIIDSVAADLLFYTDNFSQSTFAGLQYWKQDKYTGDIRAQLIPTVKAIEYLKELSKKIILNITPADDLINRYQNNVTQITNLEPGTSTEISIINNLFNIIIEIINGKNTGWTDKIISNGKLNQILSIKNAYNLLQVNKEYLAHETTAFVDATNFNFVYDVNKCRRDVGYMIDAVCFDMLYSGNRQSIQTGLYYYDFSSNTQSIHFNQSTATIAAFNYLSSISSNIIQGILVNAKQDRIKQIVLSNTGTSNETSIISSAISTITNIIENGSQIYGTNYGSITFTASSVLSVINSYDLLLANKSFLIEETIEFIDQTFNSGRFNYDEAKCYRDVGLIVDAVSQDILLGGNRKSIEAGLSYWSSGYNAVGEQISTTTMAINYAKNLSLQIIANKEVTKQTGTTLDQIINPFFQYGGDYMPQEAVRRNFNIITTIIEKGPLYAPPEYSGGGLFALTGISADQVQLSPKVVSVVDLEDNKKLIGLSSPTIGPAFNASLYFGDTLIYPLRDNEIDELSYAYTGNTSTWNLRKIDKLGSMGGSLVDGAVISDRSPIQSFVYDAFTQVTQGGRGVHITNNGYAQLVSVFTIFCSVGVQVDNGGIASIVNSNANFGNICLLAKGYGKRKFTGTVYNPSLKAYPPNPLTDQYYPEGFWPNNGRVRIFLPDLDDRPHISLIMEVSPPDQYINEQSFPGFLNAIINTSTITTGSITISNIDTTGIAKGNSLHIRDQFGNTSNNGTLYVDTGTIVTDVGFRSITLNKALTSGGGEIGNDNYFNLYFSGNAYYTVLSSEVGENPLPVGTNVLSLAAGLSENQVPIHIDALTRLNLIVNQVISNVVVDVTTGTVETQVINQLITGGDKASTFINQEFNIVKNIINAANLTAAEAIVPLNLRKTNGAEVQGSGSAINLISLNIDFFADEIFNYVNYFYPTLTYNSDKCKRDVKIILQRLIYDLETGGNYNAVLSGLSYWQRNRTHHIVQLGENVRRTDLFPDGSTVNFYQRSYMSASGYVFEYVGAGIDYGALPQRGVADPKQEQEVVMLDGGKVFFTSTDQNGDFRIGPGLVISQATGVLSGRTFTKSLFANMTPFILAIEAGQL